MPEKLTQVTIDRVNSTHSPGSQLYCNKVPALRIRVGKKSATYFYTGTINVAGSPAFSMTIARTDLVTLKQAQDSARQIKLDASQGKDPRRPRTEVVPTVAEALDKYLRSRNDLSPKTVHWYQSMVDGPLKRLANKSLDKLSRDDCRTTHERLTRNNGAYTANASMRVLKLLHNDVARTFDLPPNPVSRAVRMNKEEARDAAILPDDMPAMWDSLLAIDNPIKRTAWLTCVLTGLRSNDVRSMRFDRISDGILHVPEPKGGRSFYLPLPQYLLKEIEALKPVSEMWPDGWCFPARSKTGHLQSLRRSSTFDYHPHQFRHGFRSYALAAGVDDIVVKLLLNHKDPSVTARYLTKDIALERMKEGVEAVAEKLLSYRQH